MRDTIVIIGAGFGGLELAKRLDKKKWNVVLVDRNNYHSFPPLFYQVATSGLDSASISFPLRREMRRGKMHGVDFHMGDVSEIRIGSKEVVTQYETISYDRLVIAAGTTNNFFRIPDLDKDVNTLKSTSEAIRCRNDILMRLERAAVCRDPERRRVMLSFTIVGGGPAGVEVAGALGEMKRYVIPKEYPSIKQEEVSINLVEGTDSILGFLPEKLRLRAEQSLKGLMVNVLTGRTMRSYKDNKITFAEENAEPIYSETLIWTAGVTGNTFRLTGTEVTPGHGNRFVVDEYNRVEGLDDVYAVGDIAIHTDQRFPKGVPQLAQGAIQQARTLARNLNSGEWKHVFSYRDKGTMATIGRNKAVAHIGRLQMSGLPAWMMWMAVHLLTLMGMRNKIVVFVNWIWGYFSFSSSLRLIMRQARYPLSHRWHGDA
nr:NAD(P)/FAD-dependent oxidoreductase [uncultured Duncaniella sp.]